MSNNKWIGTAFGLALRSATLTGCNFNGRNSQQAASGNASTSHIDGQWKSNTEKQLRDAIAEAPANGLKPELFLKGGEQGAALTQAALKYASALANGYADPSKLHEVYTIPRANLDVRQGLAQAIQRGDVKGWLDSLVPQTDEYRALSQAHLRYLQLAAKGKPQPIPDGKPIKPGKSDARIALVRAALTANEIIAQPQPQPQRRGGTSAAHAAPARPPTHYSPDLVAAVKRVQAEFGLKPDGVI